MTDYGPVCGACRPHFVVPRPCAECAKPSKRLTRVSRLGLDVQVCPQCARRDFSTCSECRRHRLLSKSDDGRLLCKACLTLGTIACLSCESLMPAGRGKECEICYWRGVHLKRVKLDQAAFVSQRFAALFAEFGTWLERHAGPQRAALAVHRYLSFFTDIEKRWGDIPAYPLLLEHFGAEGLRRVRLPMKWLRECRQVTVDAAAREQDSESRRIRALVAAVPVGTVCAKTLLAYKMELEAKSAVGKSSIRSVRLALRPAVSLFQYSDLTGHTLPDQAALDRYLRDSPGQFAALGGFIRFLNRRHNLHLHAFVDKKRVIEGRRKKLEALLWTLTREADESREFLRNWISTSLMYFHNLPLSVARDIDTSMVRAESGGYFILFAKREYWIPRWESLTRTGA